MTTIDLKQQLEERNNELNFEMKKVSDLLNNMKQAIFGVDPDGTIVGPVSKYSEVVFERPIINEHIFELLYSAIPMDTPQYTTLKSAFITVFGADEIQWVLMQNVFPSRIVSKFGSKEKILKVVTLPLWSDHGTLERLMYVIEDVTELEALNRKVELEKVKSGQKMEIVQELISNSMQDIFELFETANQMINEVTGICEQQKITKADLDQILRHLHTMKGNARSYGLSLLTGVTHRVETEFCKIRNNFGTINIRNAITEFDKNWVFLLREQVAEYSEMIRKLYHFDKLGSIANNEEVKAKFKVANDLLKKHHDSLPSDVYEKISVALSLMLVESSFEIFRKLITSTIVATAADCEKHIDYNIQGSEFTLPEKTMNLLEDALVQITRNCIDHGIEDRKTREAAKKSRAGHLSVRFDFVNTNLKIEISDDGAGIDLEGIKEKGVAMRFITPEKARESTEQDLIDLLFTPGFTTRENISETSGRGIGLDIVKVNIEKLGGSIQVKTIPEKGSTFILLVPIHREI
jgi:two-component system chemotaxis sensor kinase CheA